ncbi:HtaA domain-containing protein [Streptomyces sp. NPDC089799]|uniref:HtaA domain-containing protein n=1 Tax=Streptomyces sp. NPDC089799 TaxID=3155066 RepID=UPI00341908C9
MSSSPYRSPLALAAAALTAVALGATTLSLPGTATAAEGPATPLKVTGGTLDWGVKASYRAYVTGMAAGTIAVADGAQRNADGTFRFGSATGLYDPAGHVVKAAFKGSVTFSSPAPPAGHGFEVKLSDFRIDSGTRQVTADVTKGGTTAQDVPLATAAFTGPDMTGLATTLTKQAADSLGSATYENKPGDPLTAKLEFERPGPKPTGTSGTTPSPTATKTPTKAPNPTKTPTQPPTKPPAKTPSTTKTPAPPRTGSPAPAGPQKLVAGKATWGMKESFRRYVQNAGGTVTPAGGAVRNGELFDFALGKGDLDTKNKKLNASFDGSLNFRYAAHGIDMTFSGLRVRAAGGTGTLVLDVRTASGTKAAVPFATLDLSKADYRAVNGALALNGVPAVFTAQGAAVFANGTTGSMYREGQAIDPLTLSVTVDRNAPLPAGSAGTSGSGGTSGSDGTARGGGSLASTGAEVPAGSLLAASGVVVAAGAGSLLLARRSRTPRR